jgi:hypothetical protein
MRPVRPARPLGGPSLAGAICGLLSWSASTVVHRQRGEGRQETAFEPQSGEAPWDQRNDLFHEIAVQPWAGAQRVTQKKALAKLVCCLCPKRGLTRAGVGLGV